MWCQGIGMASDDLLFWALRGQVSLITSPFWNVGVRKCRCSSVFHRLPLILNDCQYWLGKCKTSTVLMQNNLWSIRLDGSSVSVMHLSILISSCFNAPAFLLCLFAFWYPCYIYYYSCDVLYLWSCFFLLLAIHQLCPSSVGTALLSCVIWQCMRTYTIFFGWGKCGESRVQRKW